jgi:hypothetical protein
VGHGTPESQHAANERINADAAVIAARGQVS